jgi:hypothetical protein
MQDPSHGHPELNRPDDFHRHDVALAEEATAAGINSMLMLILAAVGGLILLGLVFAWSPWSGDEGVTPGQGGQDTPVPEQQAPERLPQQQR